MNALINQLKNIGFNEYESKCYISLVKLGATTAYQVSKDSGIPRARIYDILDNLVQRGIVLKEELHSSTTYSPLPVDVFLKKTSMAWQNNFNDLSEGLKHLENDEVKLNNRVVTLKDRETIISYCKELINKAEKRIVISMWDEMYTLLEEALQAVNEKVVIQGITLHVENPLKQLDIHRITPFTEAHTSAHWFILSVDSEEMIYGPSLEARPLAFYTDDPVHIYLLEDYVWHDVLVNRLVRRYEEDLEGWITKERKRFFME